MAKYGRGLVCLALPPELPRLPATAADDRPEHFAVRNGFHRELPDPSSLEDQRRDQREIGIGAQILLDLNLRRVRLLTNHPRRVPGLEGYGIAIVDQVPIAAGADAGGQEDGFSYRSEEVLV